LEVVNLCDLLLQCRRGLHHDIFRRPANTAGQNAQRRTNFSAAGLADSRVRFDDVQDIAQGF